MEIVWIESCCKVIKFDIPSADFNIMLPVYPSDTIISQSPDVILFGSIKPTK